MLIGKVNDMIGEIQGVIFKAEFRRLGQWVDRLCRQNQEAYCDETLQAFVYSGKVYKPVAQTLPDRSLNRRGLHVTLADDMDTYLMDLTVLNRDKDFIRQALFSLLDPCQDYQEVRDTLPDCLSDTLGIINSLARGSNSEAFTIADNPRAVRQYEKIRPRIVMYATTRMIY